MRTCRTLLIFVFVIATIASLMALPAQAQSVGPVITDAPTKPLAEYTGGEIASSRAQNTFYAYVLPGETLDVAFTRAEADSTERDIDSVLTVTSPDGTALPSCTITKADPVGKTCSYSGLSSATAGTWQISYLNGTSRKSPPAHWDISVTDNGTAVPGRVWTSVYAVQQQEADDFNLYYLSEFGYQYRGTYRDYDGIWSDFQSTATGVTIEDTCVPVNASVEHTSSVIADRSACGLYKIFFAPPATDLPANVTLPDGTGDWLLNPISAPSLGELSYRPTSPISSEGTFHLEVSNFNGTVHIRLDIDNNGTFDPDTDREISWGVTVSETSDVEIAWDGLDGTGLPVENCRELSAVALIDEAAPIYFVNHDVEGRDGGFELEHLNGPQTGDDTVYWNDTALSDDRSNSTPVKDGTEGINSTGGVHGWDYSRNSWGNNRDIQDWAFNKANIRSAEIPIHLPCSEVTIGKTADTTTAGPGDTITYQVEMTNTGEVDYTENHPFTITDDLTEVLQHATYNNDATATTGSVTYDEPVLTWSGPISTGNTVSLTYSVTVAPDIQPGVQLSNAVVTTAPGAVCEDSADSTCEIVSPPQQPDTPDGVWNPEKEPPPNYLVHDTSVTLTLPTLSQTGYDRTRVITFAVTALVVGAAAILIATAKRKPAE